MQHALAGEHYRLRSLWDIMKPFFPHTHLTTMRMLETILKSRVDKFDSVLGSPVGESGDHLISRIRKQAQTTFADQVEQCAQLGLTASRISAEKILTLLSNSECPYETFLKLVDELQERLIDEMSAPRFFSLTDQEAEYYNNSWKGWEEIVRRFPDTTRDAEEMSKCFALSRYPASMFHALHVAEWGAIKLGDYIGVIDPKKGWGPTEKKLRELLKGGHSNLPVNLANKFEFLEQMGREIDSMTLAWRHKVDHAANYLAIVPNAEFTPDIAEHIIGAVKVFMTRLLEGIPE